MRWHGFTALLVAACSATPASAPEVSAPPVVTVAAVDPEPVPEPLPVPTEPPPKVRAAPFDALDDAPLAVLRLLQPADTLAGLGLPPELLKLSKQSLQQLQKRGVLPPGLIPPTAAGLPTTPQLRGNWPIGDRRALPAGSRDELLDLLGDSASFGEESGNCFTPEMALSFESRDRKEPVEVVVSLSCNQVAGFGFPWPHEHSGLAPDTHRKLTQLYQQLFGPL